MKEMNGVEAAVEPAPETEAPNAPAESSKPETESPNASAAPSEPKPVENLPEPNSGTLPVSIENQPKN